MGGRSQERLMERRGINSSGNRKPKMATLPTVAGTNTVGSVQTMTNGTFTGDGTITITRSWLRNGVPIPGQTAATYTLVAGDSGKTIKARNTATSRFGSTIADSVGRVCP